MATYNDDPAAVIAGANAANSKHGGIQYEGQDLTAPRTINPTTDLQTRRDAKAADPAFMPHTARTPVINNENQGGSYRITQGLDRAVDPAYSGQTMRNARIFGTRGVSANFSDGASV